MVDIVELVCCGSGQVAASGSGLSGYRGVGFVLSFGLCGCRGFGQVASDGFVVSFGLTGSSVFGG
jgi:hypothetical protein